MAKATAKVIEKARQRRVVPIPDPPKSAFNKDRRAGALLQAQALHLRHGLSRYVQKVARHLYRVGDLLATDLSTLKTEGQIGEYARKVTAILHMKTSKRAPKYKEAAR
jgi:hypothetical protein